MVTLREFLTMSLGEKRKLLTSEEGREELRKAILRHAKIVRIRKAVSELRKAPVSEKPEKAIAVREAIRGLKEKSVEEHIEEPPKEYTKKQLLSLSKAREIHTYAQLFLYKRRVESQIKQIDPHATYQIATKYPGQYRIVTGRELKEELRSHLKEAERSFAKQKEAEALFRKEIKEYPKGTKFRVTEEGVEAVIPESARLEWTEYYLEKTKKLPPFIREATQAYLGVESSMHALFKPVARVFGKGRVYDVATTLRTSFLVHPFETITFQTKKIAKTLWGGLKKTRWDVHYVSPWDVPFEQVGWSPRGATSVMAKHPAFTVGGVIGEVAQSVAIGKALKPVGWGVKTGVKGVIKRIPATYLKISKVVPEEKLLGPITRIGETPVATRMYQWATKGYKKGVVFARQTVKPKIKIIEEITEFGTKETRRISKKMVYRPRFVPEKKWLSPRQLREAQSFIAKKLREGYTWKGIFRKQLVKKYDLENIYYQRLLKESEKVVIRTTPMKTGLPSREYGSFYNIGRRTLPLLESEVKGIPVYSKTGRFLGYKQIMRHPLGKYTTPLKKKWITKLYEQKMWWVDEEAIQSLVPPRRLTIKTSVFKTSLPSTLYQQFVFPTPSSLPMHGVSLALTGVLKRRYVKTYVTLLQQKVGYETIKLPSMEFQKISIQTPVVSPVLKTRVSLKTDFVTILKPPVQITKPVTTVKPSVAKPVVSKGIPKPFSPFLFPEYPKKGRVYIDWSEIPEKYKFREFKIPALFKGVKI